MTTENMEFKVFNIKMPKSVWVFLKHQSIEDNKPMRDIIIGCLEKYIKRSEARSNAE